MLKDIYDIDIINYEQLNNNINDHKHNIIAKGSYGIIYDLGFVIYKKFKMLQNNNSRDIALKSFIKETAVLIELLQCQNIIEIIDYNININNIYDIGIIFKKYAYPLDIIITNCNYTSEHIKFIMKQLLNGIAISHKKYIIHRDIKPNNILLDENYNIFIADWGLSRIDYSSHINNELAQTIWYRAPEILFEMNKQTNKMDMWSIGIIFLELICKKKGIITGNTNYEQLNAIFKNLGWLNNDDYIFYEKYLSKHNIFKKHKHVRLDLENICIKNNINEAGRKLLCELLQYNPEKRITAEDALNHEYFTDIVQNNIIHEENNIHEKNNIILQIINIPYENITYDDILLHSNNWITYNIRSIIILLFLKFIRFYKINLCEILLAVKIFDIISSKITIPANSKLIIGIIIVCIRIIINLLSDHILNYSDIVTIYFTFDDMDEFDQYIDDLYDLEIYILNMLNMHLYFRTPLFILEKLKISNIFEYDPLLYNISEYLIVLILSDYDYLKYTDLEIICTVLQISIMTAKFYDLLICKDKNTFYTKNIEILKNLCLYGFIYNSYLADKLYWLHIDTKNDIKNIFINKILLIYANSLII